MLKTRSQQPTLLSALPPSLPLLRLVFLVEFFHSLALLLPIMSDAPASSSSSSLSSLGSLVSIIGDEDTVTGFLLSGIGHRDEKNQTNFLVVDQERTKHEDIVNAFKTLTSRDDISVLLITQSVASDIRYLMNSYDKVLPAILEIPSKDKPYNEAEDPIMQRVLKLLGSRD